MSFAGDLQVLLRVPVLLERRDAGDADEAFTEDSALAPPHDQGSA